MIGFVFVFDLMYHLVTVIAVLMFDLFQTTLKKQEKFSFCRLENLSNLLRKIGLGPEI